MANEYYYLGRSMGMAKLFGHNSFVCVDTRSWESLSYVQGYPVEPNEVSVMTRFVGPGDTFVDIGANVGLYSMIAAERIGSQGRLVAFEANPHTYEYLRHSAIANRLIWLPHCKFENLAVSDEAGAIEFAFDPHHLGGGHIKAAHETSETMTIVPVQSVRLDDYFNQNETINFVKIDVEGHELSVLKGMTQTILRSPQIRILMEYYTFTSEVTEYGKGVVEYVRSLGFGICQVAGNGILEVVPENVIPTGNQYLLATRTPDLDATIPINCIKISPNGLVLHDIYREGEHALLTESGVLEYHADKSADVVEPTLFFGPYIDLPAGTYQLIIDAEGSGSAHISVTANAGHTDITSFRPGSWPARTKFTVKENVRQFEVVLRKTDSLKKLQVRQLTLTRV